MYSIPDSKKTNLLITQLIYSHLNGTKNNPHSLKLAINYKKKRYFKQNL